MCGVVAVVNKYRNGFYTQQMDAFTNLLFLDTLRGEDSTGTFLVDNLGNCGIAKSTDKADSFMDSEEFKKLKTHAGDRGWAWVGHNRKATRGNITDQNAHPFWVDDKLVLVHNGTMFGDHKKLADVEVDSEAIARCLAEHGDNVEKALAQFNAAYALIWYDVEQKKLNVLRNNQRPLWTISLPSCYIFASEKPFLDFIVARNQLTVERPPSEVSPDTLIQFTLQKDKGTEVEVRKLGKYTPPTVLPIPHTNLTPTVQGSKLMQGLRDVINKALGETPENDKTLVLPHHHAPAANAEIKSTTPSAGTLAHIVERRATGIPPEYRDVMVSFVSSSAEELRGVTFSRWKWLCEKYKKGDKIKVFIKDMFEHGDECFLSGYTADDENLYVMFPVKDSKFDELISMENKNGELFEIEVDRVIWRRDDSTDTLREMDKWVGYAAMYAANPTKVQFGTGCSC